MHSEAKGGDQADVPDYLSRYNWRDLPKINAMMQQAARENGAQFLNVWPMSDANGQGRFDPPVDCVHQCLPGPMDEWSRLLIAQLVAQDASV